MIRKVAQYEVELAMGVLIFVRAGVLYAGIQVILLDLFEEVTRRPVGPREVVVGRRLRAAGIAIAARTTPASAISRTRRNGARPLTSTGSSSIMASG